MQNLSQCGAALQRSEASRTDGMVSKTDLQADNDRAVRVASCCIPSTQLERQSTNVVCSDPQEWYPLSIQSLPTCR